MVVADDMGLHLGCYGDEQAHTPHLDRFAQKGILFERAFVTSASCSPSRASILTGRYPHQVGQIGLSHHGFSMDRRYSNLPARLKKEGYYTGVLGKIHVEPTDAFGFAFKWGGFDYQVSGERKLRSEHAVSVIGVNGEPTEKRVKLTQMPKRIARAVDQFLKNAKNRPFFLMVNILDPHKPLYRSVQGIPWDPHLPAELKKLPVIPPGQDFDHIRAAGYYNGVTRADASFGRILEALRRWTVIEDTIVIFLSDHGPIFHHGKTTNYEQGLHIPLLARFPDFEAPSRIAAMVSTIDLFPTLLDVLGLPGRGRLPGRSSKPLFYGQQWKSRSIYGEFTFHDDQMLKPMRSIRTSKYKLIHNAFAPYSRRWRDQDSQKGHSSAQWLERYASKAEWELYDITSDPYERENLSYEEHKTDIKERLKGCLRSWQRKTEDFLIREQGKAKLLQQAKQIWRGLRK
jgi:N-sulfoglucosamine sulfohydrolase